MLKITIYRLITFVLVGFWMAGCTPPAPEPDLAVLIETGEYTRAEALLKERIGGSSEEGRIDPEIQLETISRLRKEFPFTREEVFRRLQKYYPGLTGEMLDKWENDRQLEMRVIDGEKRYFSRSVSNFFRLNEEAKALKESIDGKAYDGVEDFQKNYIPKYFEAGIESGIPFDSKKIRVNYTITVKPNQVPAGELVKCWLPYPRIHRERSPRVEFLGAGRDKFVIAPEETMQRTVYMEKEAVKDSATIFSITFDFYPAAQWFDIDPDKVLPYDKSSELYKTYTSERLPHIVFSDEVKALAREIVGNETNPARQVALLYKWNNDNVPWAGALEYSTMPCIPEYVLENGHGDCGMQTFLFLSMARSLGIPCKWQSGWYLLPTEKNLHDWAEVYYEGIGWVPVDPSFKLIDSDDKRVKEFYLSGIDGYRLIVNDDYARELYPPKKHYRSEPFDFQRGEVEWEGGNLYFDQWTYSLDVEYLD